MAQYQSFPDAAGDSLTLDKAKALRLPDLEGRSFLDVGCNEGFFCGLAKFLGAERVVGIDHSRLFVDRARQRFPDCDFHCASWDEIPEGPYDVILLASALHYADDQPALIQRLIALLAPGGVLVLELGIFSSGKSEWVKVERGIDERYFPTMPKVREILKDQAWKWMGPSVTQEGDPVARHVVHVTRRLPVAYLLMHPPAHGKSSIAAHLFGAAHVDVVSGDHRIHQLALGKVDAPAALSAVVKQGYSPFRLDELIQKVFDAGLGGELVDFWIAGLEDRDFALDAYVPTAHHGIVRSALVARGYLPVVMGWERSDLGLLPHTGSAEKAESFYLSLKGDGVEGAGAPQSKPRAGSLSGFVDEVLLAPGQLLVRGWAVDESGALPGAFQVQLDGRALKVSRIERLQRNDVQRHLKLDHALVGFRLTIDTSGQAEEGLRGALSVGVDDRQGRVLPLGREVDSRWTAGR